MQNVIHLTEDIDSWDEPRRKLAKVVKILEPYYGKQVIVWGGGGASASYAVLDKVTIEPSILRDGKGCTIRAQLSRLNPPISPLADDNGKWTPWLGSWQISAEQQTVK